jgi:hypothetical protein
MNAELQLVPIRSKAVWGRRIRFAARLAAALLLLPLTSCSQAIRQGDGSSYLVITNLTGGADNDSTVESDVLGDDGTIFTDVGQASMQLVMKDQGGPGPSPVNAITITQYRVEYIRSDGRNTQGVDVPFAFTSGTTATITNTGSVNFTLVRIQAKLEAPLKALGGFGGALVISTIARVTFYGRDQAGHEVSVSGNIDVTFANWAG